MFFSEFRCFCVKNIGFIAILIVLLAVLSDIANVFNVLSRDLCAKTLPFSSLHNAATAASYAALAVCVAE